MCNAHPSGISFEKCCNSPSHRLWCYALTHACSASCASCTSCLCRCPYCCRCPTMKSLKSQRICLCRKRAKAVLGADLASRRCTLALGQKTQLLLRQGAVPQAQQERRNIPCHGGRDLRQSAQYSRTRQEVQSCFHSAS